MVYIFDSLDEVTLEEFEAELMRLPLLRRKKALKYKNQADRVRSVWSYKLLKEGLANEFGILEDPTLGFGSRGKPFLADYPNVFFNLSHCRRAVVCVIDTVPVGIDVETLRNVGDDLMEYTCSAQEIVSINEHNDRRLSFFTLWTKKESYLKAIGTGIKGDLKTTLCDIRHDARFESSFNVSKEYVYTVCRLIGGEKEE